jgi:hypothetical protein
MRSILPSVAASGTRRFAFLLSFIALSISCSDTPPAPTGLLPGEPLLSVGGTPNKQDWKQCQNDKNVLGPCKWVTGNLNKQHNQYFEGDVVPHALRIPQILDGNAIEVIMTYGFKKANKSTHDFLARWNATQVNANPCVDGSFAPFCTSGSLKPITARSNDMGDEIKAVGAYCSGGNDAAELDAAITAFDAQFPAGGNYPNGQKVIEGINVASIVVTNIATTCASNGDAETVLTMTVTPDAQGVSEQHMLLLIGSHIASGIYWETFGGAGGVRGSPYHLGLVRVGGVQAGSMDLQMSSDAVAVPGASLAIQKQTIGGTGSFDFVGSGTGIPNSFSRNTSTQGNPTTAAAFQITNLQFGDKYVQETVPAGWSLTDIQCTSNGATVIIGRGGSGAFTTGGTNGFDAGDNTIKATVGSGHSPTCTFVNTEQPGTISGLKFHDLNANGVNNSDPGLGGWTIRLYNSSDVLVASTTTSGPSGAYSFASVASGTYRVCEVLQGTWTQSAPSSGPDCNQNGVTDEAPKGYTVVLGAGGASSGNVFGNYQNSTLRVRKYEDLNANGAKDGSDAFITWPTDGIHVFGINGTSGHFHGTISDAANGVTFSLAPGSYRICESQQTGWFQSEPSSATLVDCSGHTGAAGKGYELTVTSGDTETPLQFGNYQGASITVKKWEDLDASGTKNGAESYITWAADMHVFNNGLSVHEHGQITSASDGVTFTVAPGTYTICESQIAGWAQSAPGAGTSCAGHAGATGNGFSVTVASGGSASREFGNYQAGTITVRKWNDEDGDGTKNGSEAYITWAANMHVFNAGLTVHQHQQITDAANGTSFTVPPGTYTVCESLVAGWVQTFPGAGVSCAGHTGATGNGFSVSVASGGSEAVEFGNRQPPAPPGEFILIDEDGIDNGPRYWEDGGPYNAAKLKSFTTNEVNDDMPGLARRSQLRYFRDNPGKTIWLWTGQVGDEGWFAPRTIPSSWAGAGPTTDGLRNFLGDPTASFPHNVGPGLGTGSDPESLLDKIPNVIPLRAEGLYGLIGKTVCALVWDSDISINYNPIEGSLKGEKLGVAAFLVQDVVYLSGFSSSTLPRVKVQIADANQVCAGTLGLNSTAPVPSSSSVPADIRPNFAGDNAGYQ